MSFFNKLLKKLVFVTLLIFSTNLLADSHDKNNSSKEEALPLNDPFVGDSSFSGGVKVITEGGAPSTERKRIDLYTYKLAGIIKSDSGSFISLINQDGEIITVAMYEEVSDGVKLVDMTTKEAVFETEEKYLIMNFKNQIKEQSEY
tara:strand:- start:259 stop:696 length:438 start_codon:yes stop_codon:yes gene_type:complete